MRLIVLSVSRGHMMWMCCGAIRWCFVQQQRNTLFYILIILLKWNIILSTGRTFKEVFLRRGPYCWFYVLFHTRKPVHVHAQCLNTAAFTGWFHKLTCQVLFSQSQCQRERCNCTTLISISIKSVILLLHFLRREYNKPREKKLKPLHLNRIN